MARATVLTMLLISLQSVLWAADYYVDGTSGNDKNTGTSWSAAPKNISTAYAMASDGDCIHVADGIYGRVSVNGQKKLTISSQHGRQSTFIDGKGVDRLGEFTGETFPILEGWLNKGHAVGITYLHGTPSSNNGDHVVTVWGVFKDLRYLPTDPRHYCAVVLSDSDDDKTGYASASDAPNRLKIWPVTWNDAESVYEIDDGFLVDCYSLAPHL